MCAVLHLVGIWCVSISSWNLLLSLTLSNVGLAGALLFYEFIQFPSCYQPNWKKLGEKFNRKAATVTKDSDGDTGITQEEMAQIRRLEEADLATQTRIANERNRFNNEEILLMSTIENQQGQSDSRL